MRLSPQRSEQVWNFLAGTVGHFLLMLLTGVVAFGADFDQLRSRTPASRTAAAIHDVLMAPHSWVIRSMPNAWLTQGTVPVIPLLVIAHSAAWGLMFMLAWRAVTSRRVGLP